MKDTLTDQHRNYLMPAVDCSESLPIFTGFFGFVYIYCFINHKKIIPYHTECVSYPTDHFKAIKKNTAKRNIKPFIFGTSDMTSTYY